MRYVVSAVLLALALTGCGGGDDPAPRAAPPAPTTSSEIDMRTACPQVEAALPTNVNEGANADPVVDPNDIELFQEALADLLTTADLETRNAFEPLQAATTGIVEAITDGPQPFLRAQDPFYEALDAVADRCAAAGSSAFS